MKVCVAALVMQIEYEDCLASDLTLILGSLDQSSHSTTTTLFPAMLLILSTVNQPRRQDLQVLLTTDFLDSSDPQRSEAESRYNHKDETGPIAFRINVGCP